MSDGLTRESWSWVWPDVGATPIHEGLDSDVFDRTDYPYSQTFVREAIQNSLDARLDESEPVLMKFSFHKAEIGSRRALLTEVIQHREKAGLDVPVEWENGYVSWLLVEDFNSKGLSGSLTNRTSDFWNYWLNFGLSNKEGEGRGGKGFGRQTFFIASRLQSVIGYTRRDSDGLTAVCGMTVLRARQEGQVLKSTAAYLAEHTEGNIYKLHDSSDFHRYVCNSLSFAGYDGQFSSGFGLAILFPHTDLSSQRILAAAIENFAPAIMDRTLQLEVDGETLAAESIRDIAKEVQQDFKDDAIRSNVDRFFDLVRQANQNSPIHTIRLSNARKNDLKQRRDTEEVVDLQKRVLASQDVVFEIQFPLIRHKNISDASIQVAIGPRSFGHKSIDRLFRDGMSLPKLIANNPSDLDLVLLVKERKLATFLNFCEGKAHLRLEESKEVLQTLTKRGFDEQHARSVKRLVASMPDELRNLLTPDVTAPDSQVFDKYFWKPKATPSESGQEDRPRDPIEPLPPANPTVFKVEALTNGLRIRANPEFSDWPINSTVDLAYADGTRRPTWSPFDFKLEDLEIDYVNCQLSTDKNRLTFLNCDCETEI